MAELDESSKEIGNLQGKLDYLIRFSEAQFRQMQEANTLLSTKLDAQKLSTDAALVTLEARVLETEHYIDKQKGVIVTVAGLTGIFTGWISTWAHKFFN